MLLILDLMLCSWKNDMRWCQLLTFIFMVNAVKLTVCSRDCKYTAVMASCRETVSSADFYYDSRLDNMHIKASGVEKILLCAWSVIAALLAKHQTKLSPYADLNLSQRLTTTISDASSTINVLKWPHKMDQIILWPLDRNIASKRITDVNTEVLPDYLFQRFF